ncbi:hypothetical protein LP52_02720 [Streptomonospora alba]|uniref:Nitroreductase domain-containing protein n=1 Tax=Streptomonospora alba TaxID=183763 RepID=A0A0C2GA44_9ACTN|nr:hypothetical protein [Streptomonospora alba]KII00239.1 hypothetical protein LP52_02720 [Streptomonospora alba]
MTAPTGRPTAAPAPASDWSDEQLLAFADLQARPMRLGISTEGDDRAPVPVRPLPGPGVPLPGGLHRDLDAAADDDAARAAAAVTDTGTVAYPHGRAAPDLPLHRRVLGVLAASGIQRFEARSAVNPHRGYPAAHCFYTAHTFLLADRAGWHFDTAGHRLRPVAAAPEGTPGPADAVTAAGGAVLAIMCHPRSIPSRYRELRWALALCEAGHLAELLVQSARAYGLPVRLCRDFPDRAVAAAAGVDAGEWMPACLVELGAARAEDALPSADPDPDPGAAPQDPVLAADRRAWGAAPPASLDRTACDPRPRPGAGTGRSWARVVFERSSGHGNKGFTASPAPLAGAALDDAAAALADALGAQSALGDGGIRTLLLADRIAERAPGLYEIDRAGRARLLGAGPGLAAVQRAFSYPLSQMSVTSCAAALVFTMDQHAQLIRRGPRRLRTAQLDLGAAAQAAGLALSAHGAFLRPARSFDPDLLAAELELPDDQLPGYIALLGTSRFTDLFLDVRP